MTARQNITAIIYDKRGRILSIGKNSYWKTHPLQSKTAKEVGLPNKEFLHAEIAAIVKCADLSSAKRMLITRINKFGKALASKPCPICQKAIKDAGIKFVDHT
jgi:deoxycytidylate deaminase